MLPADMRPDRTRAPRMALPPPPAPAPPPRPRISLPTSWFRDPLDTAIKAAVRPSTARTRRKEIKINLSLPRETFEYFMSPLTAEDTEGLLRDPTTGWLLPTKETATCRRFKYSIKRGSTSDRHFHLEDLDPYPHRHPSSQRWSWRRSARRACTRSRRSCRSARRSRAASTWSSGRATPRRAGWRRATSSRS